MDHIAFVSDPEVSGFIDWLRARADGLPVRFDIAPSRYVPGGLRREVAGLEAALGCYTWRTDETVDGDWASTKAFLKQLGLALRSALAAADQDAVLRICLQIVDWGGDRNGAAGATPFLEGLHAQGALGAYLSGASGALRLDAARILPGWQPVRKMNSMLTKVHALAADDGLPIYDSRVAAALATLVEMWRRERGDWSRKPPAALAFPATIPGRTVRHAFPDARGPGLMSYEQRHETATAHKWSSAKLRLGWLMRALLERHPALFAAQGLLADRMHAFEASLFMIGSDVRCLRPQA